MTVTQVERSSRKRKQSAANDDSPFAVDPEPKRANAPHDSDENNASNAAEEDKTTPFSGISQEPDEIVEQLEEELVTGKSFNMKKFREKLREGDFIFDVRHFLQASTTNPNVVGQYLKVGGKPLELVQSLERVDKTQLFHICYVLQAMQLTLIEILSASTQHTQPAIQACSYLLNSHRNCIEKLLYSNVALHKRVALKLLTAIVTLEPQFGRDILTTLSVVFNADSLAKFTRHSKYQIAGDSAEPSVRTCYIHFVLAYLIEGNAMLIRNVLDRTELVMAVVAGLLYDDADSVCLVLGTLTRFVLRTEQVSKTKKVQVFGVPVVRHLIHLYEWRGPQYFAASLDRKRAERAADFVDADELKRVQEAVHTFVSLLLSSRKYGIAFQCLGHRRTKANATQKRILAELSRPWQLELKAQLTIDVLRACPELARSFVKLQVAPALDTRNRNGDWAAAASYLSKLTDRLDAGVLRCGVADMSALETGQLIKGLCMSPEVLQHLRHVRTLRSDELRTRNLSAQLLLSMFRQCMRALNCVAGWSVYAANDMRKIRFDLLNHVFVMCPSVEHILLALHRTLHEDALGDDQSVVDVAMEHLEAVLDLLLIISAAMPSFIEQTASVINYIRILRPIYEMNREHASSTRMELKAVRLILVLEPKALSLRTEFFQQVMHSVLNVWRMGNAAERLVAKRLLRDVFENTGLFENGASEVDLWLDGFAAVDKDDFEAVRKEFVAAMLSCEAQADDAASGSKVREHRAAATETAQHNLQELFRNIEQGISLDGNIDVPVLGRFFVHFVAQCCTSEEPEDAVLAFVDAIGLALFHYLPEANAVKAVLDEHRGSKHRYVKYMRSALDGSFRALPEDDPALVDLNAVLKALTDDDADNGEAVQLQAEAEDPDAATVIETRYTRLVHLCMFVLCQRAASGQLTAAQSTRHLRVLRQMLAGVRTQAAANAKHADDQLDFIETAAPATNASSAASEAIPIAANDSAYVKSLRYVLCGRYQLLNEFSVLRPNALTQTVFELIRTLGTAPDAERCPEAVLVELSAHFRTKLSTQIEYAVGQPSEQNALTEARQQLLDMMEVFRLEHKQCASLLEHLVRLPADAFFGSGSVYAALLGFALRRVAEVRSGALAATTVTAIGTIYVGMKRTDAPSSAAAPEIERIEDALHTYLSAYCDSIGHFPGAQLLGVAFTAVRHSKSTARLCALLVERDATLIDAFVELLPANVGRKELVYPLLNVACRRRTSALHTDQQLLASVYAEFRNGIAKTIEKPQKAAVIYRENVYASLWLIERCMSVAECVEFTKRALKYDAAEVFQLQLVKAVHLKALHAERSDVRRAVFEAFVVDAVQLFNLLLKPEPNDAAGWLRVEQFATVLANWFDVLPVRASGATFERVLKAPGWTALTRACLKLSMQRDANERSAVLLKLLALLCDRFYADGGASDDCARLFEMAVSHSAFFGLALGTRATPAKTQLMHLLFVLLRKCPAKCASPANVPIFLGAYQAKLSACDRYVLAILQAHETLAGVDLHAFRPFIWGESAVAHYAIRGTDGDAKATLHQEPPLMQVMSMIDRDCAEQTLAHFPVWRQLNAVEQVPEARFECFGIPGNEYFDVPRNANTALERYVDANNALVHRAELELLAARREDAYDELYDPAFFVPLMSMAFAPEAYVRSVRPAQNGLLAMTFAALSSQDKRMRLAGANALQRYRSHLHTARFADNQVWAHLFECVHRGLGELTEAARRGKPSRVPRVPFVAGCFLGRTINTLINPLSEMYRPLSTFLLFQNEYNFLTVPEFNVLFNSADANHVAHRHFMLEVLRDGLKCGSDFTILMGGNIFKALLGFYGTPMATRDTNLLVLTVVNQALRIPRSAKVLVDQVGVLPWLAAVIDAAEFFQFDVVDGLCNVLNSLYYSWRFLRAEYTNGGDDVQLRLFGLLAKLCPKLTTRTTRAALAKFVNVLDGCTNGGRSAVAGTATAALRWLSTENLEHLVKCARAHEKFAGVDAALAEQQRAIGFAALDAVRVSKGWRFAESRYAYVRRLREAGFEEQMVFVLATLREVIVRWSRAHEQ